MKVNVNAWQQNKLNKLFEDKGLDDCDCFISYIKCYLFFAGKNTHCWV